MDEITWIHFVVAGLAPVGAILTILWKIRQIWVLPREEKEKETENKFSEIERNQTLFDERIHELQKDQTAVNSTIKELKNNTNNEIHEIRLDIASLKERNAAEHMDLQKNFSTLQSAISNLSGKFDTLSALLMEKFKK